jgi:hypothetical protein
VTLQKAHLTACSFLPCPAVEGVAECQHFYFRVQMRTRLAAMVCVAAATVQLIAPAAQAYFGMRFACSSIRTGTDMRKEEVNYGNNC